MSLWNFWNKEPEKIDNFLQVDMHSHLLPGIDDGADNLSDSVELIRSLKELGYKKLITTPHIMGDFFKNTPEVIREKLTVVKEELVKEGIDVELEAAAEYYLDESFIHRLENNEELLTFGDNYLLFETSFLNEPVQLNQTIFLIASMGYRPVLAHPERYNYLYSSFEKYEDLFERGVYFQINLNSLAGYYSVPAKKIAEKLVKNEMVHFAGTDCHGIRHIDALKKSMTKKSFQKLSSLNLLNNQLLP